MVLWEYVTGELPIGPELVGSSGLMFGRNEDFHSIQYCSLFLGWGRGEDRDEGGR